MMGPGPDSVDPWRLAGANALGPPHVIDVPINAPVCVLLIEMRNRP